jgi:hypothetical protein
MNSVIHYIRNCIESFRLFFYKSFACESFTAENDSDTDSFQETLIELNSRGISGDNYVSFDEIFETESIVNLPEVQHYYDYNIPTHEL